MRETRDEGSSWKEGRAERRFNFLREKKRELVSVLMGMSQEKRKDC